MEKSNRELIHFYTFRVKLACMASIRAIVATIGHWVDFLCLTHRIGTIKEITKMFTMFRKRQISTSFGVHLVIAISLRASVYIIVWHNIEFNDNLLFQIVMIYSHCNRLYHLKKKCLSLIVTTTELRPHDGSRFRDGYD